MPSDYEAIRCDNIRKFGEETRHLAFLGKLYSDRTHFIFELLQNAEDAGAEKILFHLTKDKLEVFHDGRLFTPRDVIGICSIAEGEKEDDITQIGKFGIGFKSVYAYTDAPEIYSGEETFKIEHFVRPLHITERAIPDEWTTLFVFPFNKQGVEPDEAYKEIKNKLSSLSVRTLLFLQNLKEIEYELEDEPGGYYLQEMKVLPKGRAVTLIGQSTDEEISERWLTFDRPVKSLTLELMNLSESYLKKIDSVRVEVAFLLRKNKKTKQDEIHRLTDSPLVVFFPTEKITNFGFLIQGPYRTTPARDNIKTNDDWNMKLIEETAALIEDVLIHLKEHGLMNISLLQALPIQIDRHYQINPTLFFPIVEAIEKCFKTKEIIPADDGTFITSKNAKIARGEWLRKNLNEEQLSLLYGVKYKWITAEVTEVAQYELWRYFREKLDVEEVTFESFVRATNISFFQRQTDDWLVTFYKHLPNQKAMWKKKTKISWRSTSDSEGPLRKKHFIRLEDGSHVTPFDDNEKPQVYLATESMVARNIPIVKIRIAEDDDARNFLTDLEIPVYDIVEEVIHQIIPKYNRIPPPEKINHEYDVQQIVEALKTDSKEKSNQLKRILQDTKFILTETKSSKSTVYNKPGDLYFSDEQLRLYFDGHGRDCFLGSDYPYNLFETFKDLGVNETIKIKKRKSESKGYVKLIHRHGYHERGLNGFDPDIEIDGLESALNNPTLERSAFIWNHIAIPYKDYIDGIVEMSTNQDYRNSSTIEMTSEKFGRLLKENAWVPAKDGRLCFPHELDKDFLHDALEQDSKLLEILGIDKDKTDYLTDEQIIHKADIKFIEQNLEEFKKWKAQISRKHEKPEFPIRDTENSERRESKVSEEVEVAPIKIYEQRSRSIRTTRSAVDPDVWLKSLYTNDNGQMICQLCQEEMPFKKRNGEYYFETVEAFKKNYFPKEYEAQFLALCPLCSAMYKEFILSDDTAMVAIKDAVLENTSLDIPVKLGNRETAIRFVKTHFLDMSVCLREGQDPSPGEGDQIVN